MQTTRVSAHEISQLFQEAGNLVPMFARRYRSSGVAFEDLVGAGNVGVIEAAYRFDPDRGVKFCSYAGWWIRKAIVESLQSATSMVAVPRFSTRRRRQVVAAMRRGRASGESDRSPNDVAAELHLSDRKVKRALASSTSVVSIHDPVTADTGETWADRLAQPAEEGPQAVVMNADRERTAREALRALAPQQRRVVVLRYGGSEHDNEPTPLKDVARVMGLSYERVRQIEIEALKAVRLKLARNARKRSRS